MSSRAEIAADPTSENTRGFAAWAAVYDHRLNPLTALEERYLSLLLPNVRGTDVLDVGCGTGRWLKHLAVKMPRSLHGVDGSPEMLNEAAKKDIPNAQLSLALCTALPVQDQAADVILSSFTASYAADMKEFAKELFRVARNGGNVFVSDMHPETAARLGWRRSFSANGSTTRLNSTQWSLQETLAAFRQAGFTVCALIEPAFGEAERQIFVTENMLERYAEASHHPAIYLLHLQRPVVPPKEEGSEGSTLHLEGAICAIGARETVLAQVCIRDGRIASLGIETKAGQRVDPTTRSIDLNGFILLPGLINAHDHLEFALFPRLGNGPYRNAVEWAQDIQATQAPTIALHKAVPKETRLWWGALRNLLSGVTTVCHHNPINPLLQSKTYPLRVVTRFGWEHSLAFGHDIRSALKQTHPDTPFILHACEGIDAASAAELNKLDELGALEERTVLVHALALDEAGIAMIEKRKVSVIFCPSSNNFLFGKVPSGETVRTVPKAALGSDSPLTAAGDLLDEIRFTAKACDIDADHLYGLVTTGSASVLRLGDGEGTMLPGAHADLIAVRERPGDPAEILGALTWRDIELVVVGGRVQLASQEVLNRLSAADREGLVAITVEDDLRWLRVPVEQMLHEAESVLGTGAVRLGGRPVRRAHGEFSSLRPKDVVNVQ